MFVPMSSYWIITVCANLLITEGRLPLLYFPFGLNWLLKKSAFQRSVRVAIKIDFPGFPLNEPALLLLTIWGNCVSRGKSDIKFNLPGIYSTNLRAQLGLVGLNLFVPERKQKESSKSQSKCTGTLKTYCRCPKMPVLIIPSASPMYLLLHVYGFFQGLRTHSWGSGVPRVQEKISWRRSITVLDARRRRRSRLTFSLADIISFRLCNSESLFSCQSMTRISTITSVLD